MPMAWVLVLLTLVQTIAFAQGKSVSRTLAQVDNTVITSREILIAGILDRWFLTQGKVNKQGPVSKDWLLQDSSETFQKQLTQVVLETLVLQEADSFSLARVSTEDVQKTVRSIKDTLSDWFEWKKLEVSDEEISKQVSRRLRSHAFMKFKTETSQVEVSEEEAKRYYENNRLKFSDLPYAQFKEGIKEYLGQKLREEKLKDWFESLRRTHRVRFLG